MQITDEMVEAGARALCRNPQACIEPYFASLCVECRDQARACLTAALAAAPGAEGGLADLADQALAVLSPSDLGSTEQYRRDRIGALLNAAFNRGYATSKTVKTLSCR